MGVRFPSGKVGWEFAFYGVNFVCGFSGENSICLGGLTLGRWLGSKQVHACQMRRSHLNLVGRLRIDSHCWPDLGCW